MVTTFFIKLQIQTFVELLQKKNYLTLPLEIKISIIKYGNVGKKRKQIFDFMEIINTNNRWFPFDIRLQKSCLFYKMRFSHE